MLWPEVNLFHNVDIEECKNPRIIEIHHKLAVILLNNVPWKGNLCGAAQIEDNLQNSRLPV